MSSVSLPSNMPQSPNSTGNDEDEITSTTTSHSNITTSTAPTSSTAPPTTSTAPTTTTTKNNNTTSRMNFHYTDNSVPVSITPSNSAASHPAPLSQLSSSSSSSNSTSTNISIPGNHAADNTTDKETLPRSCEEGVHEVDSSATGDDVVDGVSGDVVTATAPTTDPTYKPTTPSGGAGKGVDFGKPVITGDAILNMKLKRKKVLKEKSTNRRYHTEDSDSSAPPTPNHLSPPVCTSASVHSSSRLAVRGPSSHSRSKSLQDFELSSHYRRQDANSTNSDYPQIVACSHRATSPQPVSPTCPQTSSGAAGGTTGVGLAVKKRSNAAELRSDMIKRHSLGKDCFMLTFSVDKEPNVDIIAAVRGQTLRSAIMPALDKRGINIDTISVYLSSSKSPLPQNVDSYPLGGNQLNVKPRDVDDPNPIGQKQSSLQSSTSNVSNTSSNGSLSGIKMRPVASLSAKIGSRPQSSSADRKYNAKKDGKSRLTTSVDEGQGISSLTTQYSVVSQTGSMLSGISGSISSMQGDSFSNSDQKKLAKNQSKNKVNTFFQAKNTKQDILSEKLITFEQTGLPAMPRLLTIGQKVYPEEVFKVESSWKDIVKDFSSLTKDQMDQQEALWELLQTEVNYIKKIKVIIDLFQSCLLNLQNVQILNEIETEKIFSNISEIYQVNCLFWNDHLVKVLQASRETGNLLNPLILKQAFMEFDSKFGAYKKYCLEQKNAISYISDCLNDNSLFKFFISWAEKQEQCKRLELSSMIAMPFQRLTKYKLLLKAISKKSDNHKDLIDMIKRVDIFVAHVNSALNQKLEHERLSKIINKIDSYDIIDFPNDETYKLSSSYCDFQLTNPIPGCVNERRHLLYSGNLKLKEKDSKMDIFCFLFTDLILVTKPIRKTDKVKVIKPPMRLDKIMVQNLRDGVSFVLCYLNEYHIANSVVTFHGDSSKNWVEKIISAQESYKQMRMTSRAASDATLLCYSINGQVSDNDNNDDLHSVSMHSTHESQLSQEARVSLVRQSSNCSTDMFLSSDIARVASNESIDQNMSKDMKYRCRSPDSGVSAKASFSAPKVRRYQTANSETRRSGYVEDENIRVRMNQRRAQVGHENRYHTADAIQDLTKDRGDPSIHKRHSLNMGPVSSNNNLKANDSISAESIRSIPASSSGVSSTLSLHETVDESMDISDATTPLQHIPGVHCSPGSSSSSSTTTTIAASFSSTSTISHPPVLPSTLPPSSNHNCNHKSTSSAIITSHTSSASHDATTTHTLIPSASTTPSSPPPPLPPKPKLVNKQTSKSLNDISHIAESIQGIASISASRVPCKSNYAQIMRMTKELLLNSNIEASEV